MKPKASAPHQGLSDGRLQAAHPPQLQTRTGSSLLGTFLEDINKPVQVDMASSPQPSHPLTSLPTPPLSLPQLHRWNPDPPGLRHKTYGDPGFQTPKASAGPMGSSPCAAHVHHLCPPSSCRWPLPHQEPGAPGHHQLVMPSEAKAHQWPQVAHVEPPPLINRSRAHQPSGQARVLISPRLGFPAS